MRAIIDSLTFFLFVCVLSCACVIGLCVRAYTLFCDWTDDGRE